MSGFTDLSNKTVRNCNMTCLCTWEMLLYLHHIIYGFDIRILQPEGGQSEDPGVMFLSQFQALNVVLHSFEEEAVAVCIQVSQCLDIEL